LEVYNETANQLKLTSS